jgi:CHAT domain-containing protein/Tfp pilus assembly protein PilF
MTGSGGAILASRRALRAAVAGHLLVALATSISGWQPAVSQHVFARIRSDLDSGRYDTAEIAARELVRSDADEPNASAAMDLLIEALWRNGRADGATLALAERAVVARNRSDVTAQAGALSNLGQVLCLTGEYSRAIGTFQRGLEIQEQRADGDAIGIANALDDLGRALLLSGRYDDARKAIDRALQLREGIPHLDASALASTLELSAQWFQRRGEYAKARPLVERALAARQGASPTHPALVTTLGLLGDQLWFEGAILEAAEIYRQALTLAEKTLRADHPEIAWALQNLATTEMEMGALAATVAQRERALAIAEANFGSEHPIVGRYVNNLANGHMAQQDYATARRLFERALRIKERQLGPDHESVATSVFNLAFLAGELGDVAEAERLFNRASRIWTKRLGRRHPFLATVSDTLASVLIDNGRAREALPVARRALEMREAVFGPHHVDVAQSLLQLVSIALQLGDLREAQVLAARAVAIWELAGSDSPGHGTALFHAAQAQAAAGHHADARTKFESAIAVRRRTYGPLHLDVARAQHGLAASLVHLNERSLAFATAVDAETATRAVLRATMRYLPERQAIRFSDLPPAGLDVALSLVDATGDPAKVSQALDALVLGRGVVLDEMAQRHRTSLGHQQPEVAALARSVAAGRQRLANIAVRAPSDDNPVRYATLLEAARREREAAERALAEKSASFKQELEREDIGLDAVRRALPAGSALVSIVRYDRTTAEQQATVPHYAAFVLMAGRSDPIMLQLGAARTIERAIERWRHEAGLGLLNGASPAAAEVAYKAAGDRLRNLVWDPLAPHLGDAQRVFIVPDGALSLVNFAALPIASSQYLVERAPTIHYLATERDLAAAPNETPTATGLLALGGPAFDETAAPARRSSTTRRGAPGDCGTLQSIMFERLPATLAEANEVAALWKTAAAGTPAIGGVHLSTAEQATERAFKQQAPGRRVLHLATHGFFLGGDCSPAAPGTRAVGRVTAARPASAPAIATQNPLLVSGLAFAGANLRAGAKPDEEDGVLTAEEIAGMNLQGTEWAVLSACDTGLGAVKAGEGVFGLRRAFQIAGVRTVIMSLWSVEDEATRRWMRALYRARLYERLDTAESVRAATLRVLQDRRARKLSTHPFHWGAFVSAGDWR